MTFAGTLSFLFLGDVLFDLADDAQLPEKLLFDTAASEVAGDLRPVGGSFLLLPLLLAPRRPADLPIGAEALVPDEMLLMLMSVLLLLLLVLPILVPVPVLLSTHAAALWNGKGLAAGLQITKVKSYNSLGGRTTSTASISSMDTIDIEKGFHLSKLMKEYGDCMKKAGENDDEQRLCTYIARHKTEKNPKSIHDEGWVANHLADAGHGRYSGK